MDHHKSTVNQRCKYVKMPVKTKIAFFKKVLKERMSIKDVILLLSSLQLCSALTTLLPKLSWGNISLTHCPSILLSKSLLYHTQQQRNLILCVGIRTLTIFKQLISARRRRNRCNIILSNSKMDNIQKKKLMKT